MRPPRAPAGFHEWTMSDGYVLRGRVWQPQAQRARRGILYLHGIESHGGWFEHSASLLAETGCGVVLADRRGSGLNAQDRGDVPLARRWHADLDELADWTCETWGVSAIDLVGVSWGGKLALSWALGCPGRVGRVLLITPGIFSALDLTFREKLTLMRSLVTRPDQPFRIPLDDPALFTDNPQAQSFVRSDPLRLHEATARFFYHSFRLDSSLRRVADNAITIPVSLFLAECDQIIRNARTRDWVRRISGGRAEITEFPGASHTLEFARDPALFDEMLGVWVQEPH